LEKIGFKKNEKPTPPPYNYDNDPSPIPTLLSINPTVKKDITGDLLPKSEVFQITPEKVVELDMSRKNCRIKIKFFLKGRNGMKVIERMKEILKSRYMKKYIDVDDEGYKKKERDIIDEIMSKKGIEEKEESIYKISERIVIMKGV